MSLSKTGFNLIIVLAALGFAMPASADIMYSGYTRTPAGASITNPVLISVNMPIADFLTEVGDDWPFWGISFDVVSAQCVEKELGGDAIADFVFNLPAGNYTAVRFMAGANKAECETLGFSEQFTLEYNPPENILFTISAGSGVIIPVSAAGAVIGQVSDQMSDLGTIGIIALAMALPILFYIARRLIKLTPVDKKL